MTTTKQTTEPRVVRQAVEKAHIWVNEVAEELGGASGEDAYRALRAVLHTLRDRLAPDEAAQLSAQLPIFVRGVYFEGWRPSGTPLTYRDVDGFLERVGRELVGHGETEASFAVDAVMRVLRHHVSAGELEDIRAALPVDLRTLLFEAD